MASNSFCLNYTFYICIAGFVFLNIFGILAFANVESLKIKKGNHVKSGIMLVTIACVIIFLIDQVYGVLALLLFFKTRKSQSIPKQMFVESNSLNSSYTDGDGRRL